MDHESLHQRLRHVAAELDDGPAAVGERGAHELLGEPDPPQTELERLQRGLEATAERLGAARPDGPGR